MPIDRDDHPRPLAFAERRDDLCGNLQPPHRLVRLNLSSKLHGLLLSSCVSSVRVKFRDQLTAFFTSPVILVSSAAVSFFSAKSVGHMWPSSRFALSLKPSVAYLDLNLCALL